MLLSKKSTGYFIEANGHSVTLARTSAVQAPLVVQEILTCTSMDDPAFPETLKTLQPKRSGQYLHATCAVYSANRVVRHATLDPKRYKETDYLNDVLANTLHVDGDKNTLALLNADDGTDLDLSATGRKEALFVGMPSDEILSTQTKLLGQGVYPDRLEVGTLSTLGAVVDYLRFSKTKTPTLVLELEAESTQSYIVSESGVENSRTIPQGLEAMIPAVQKEIGLKDADAARKLFYSNAFDFTGIAPALIKKLLKELQSSIGFYEVQTGESIGQVICTVLPPKLSWLESAISAQLGVATLAVDFPGWLKAKEITLAAEAQKHELNNRWLGLFSLMISHKNAVAS